MTRFIAPNICLDCKIFQHYCQLVFIAGLVKNNSHFVTATDVTVNNLVNVERVGEKIYMLLYFQFPSCRSCLVHTVDHFDSEGWFNCHQVIF